MRNILKNEALLPLEDSIGNLLATMSDSIEIRIRILQEFLLLSKNTDHLRKIINYVMKQDGERIPYFFTLHLVIKAAFTTSL